VIHIFAVMDFGGPVSEELQKVPLGATQWDGEPRIQTQVVFEASTLTNGGYFCAIA
jgi:hypothetical protein